MAQTVLCPRRSQVRLKFYRFWCSHWLPNAIPANSRHCSGTGGGPASLCTSHGLVGKVLGGYPQAKPWHLPEASAPRSLGSTGKSLGTAALILHRSLLRTGQPWLTHWQSQAQPRTSKIHLGIVCWDLGRCAPRAGAFRGGQASGGVAQPYKSLGSCDLLSTLWSILASPPGAFLFRRTWEFSINSNVLFLSRTMAVGTLLFICKMRTLVPEKQDLKAAYLSAELDKSKWSCLSRKSPRASFRTELHPQSWSQSNFNKHGREKVNRNES